MTTAKSALIAVATLTVILVAQPALPQQPTREGKGSQALQAREKAMQDLAADGKRVLDNLKSLTPEQKHSVVALMAVTRAAAIYESRFLRKDDAALRALYGSLSQFSPAYRAPANFYRSLMTACFDQMVACANAQKKCRDGGGSEDQCDRNPAVIQACANEVICVTSEFARLHQRIPDILGGRDPWPQPKPFPY